MTKKVLIVDDEPHIRLLLEQALDELEEAGVTLLLADDGEQALTLLRAERPQLVLLDVMMPKLNGFEVCKTIKADPALRGTFVLMLTAKGQELDRVAGEEVGADVYMTKPFDPDDVLEKAAEVLGVELD